MVKGQTKRRQIVFQVEFDSPPSPPNHIILPSGIAVIGIDSWVARFETLFQKTLTEDKVLSSDPILIHPRSQLPSVTPLQHPGVTDA